MVSTFGNDIISAFTGGTSVKAIYTYGVQVWPSSGPQPTEYYISWTPSDATGVFTIDGRNYRLEDYSGYFNYFDGVITQSAFKGNNSITTLETNARIIGSEAFTSCYSLSIVSIYSCTHISSSAFRYCTSLRNVYAECAYIGSYAFYNTSVKYIRLPYCSQIGGAAFGGNESSFMYVTLGYDDLVAGAGGFGNYAIYNLSVPAWLRSSYSNDYGWFTCMHGYPDVFNISTFHYLSCPGYYSSYISGGGIDSSQLVNISDITSITTDATGIGDGCFKSCSTIREAYLIHCIEVGTSGFQDCYNLQTVEVSTAIYIRSNAFRGCSSLEHMNISGCLLLESNAFRDCTSLLTVKIGSACSLYNSNTFLNCSSLTSIYVPSSNLTSYKTSENWSYYSSLMVAY